MFWCGIARYVEIDDNGRLTAQWKERKGKQIKMFRLREVSKYSNGRDNIVDIGPDIIAWPV